MKIEYIFLPKNIEDTLQKYPLLSSKLKNISEEGVVSRAFPEARKSSRQIFRVLANQHYPHLVMLLEAIENCLSNGYENIGLLKVRNISQFTSAISEIGVANNFIKRGFKVTGFDQNKGQTSVPDIKATSEKVSFIAEIYKPRDFEGLNLFVDDIRLFLKYLDYPFDFMCKMNFNEISTPSFFRDVPRFNPFAFSEDMENQNFRFNSEKRIVSQVNKQLSNCNKREIDIVLSYKEYNLKVIIKISEIKKSQHKYPNREIRYFSPSLSGYDPKLMFKHLINKKLLTKLKKAQVHKVSGDYLRILMVDVGELAYAYTGEFEHESYLPFFKQCIKNSFNSQFIKEDLVVLYSVNFKGNILVRLLFKKKNIKNKQLRSVFGEIDNQAIIVGN